LRRTAFVQSFVEVNQHLGELGWMMSERSEALRATDTIHLEKACPLRDHCTNPQITTRTCSITEDQGICDLTYALHKGPNAQLRDQKGWHQHDLLVCQVSSNFGNEFLCVVAFIAMHCCSIHNARSRLESTIERSNPKGEKDSKKW